VSSHQIRSLDAVVSLLSRSSQIIMLLKKLTPSAKKKSLFDFGRRFCCDNGGTISSELVEKKHTIPALEIPP
jgi:hypothetical protein